MSTATAESEALPSVIPIFPLAGALLLPRAELPLNIFEPRYLAMLGDALDGAGVIGMVQPREDNAGEEEPAIFDIGCAGRVTASSETEDGRQLITLEGVRRFKILEELERTTPYRQAKVDYTPFEGDALTPMASSGIDRVGLLARLTAYLDRQELEADWSSIEEAPDEALVNALTMMCPFAAAEKQALLEANSLRERAQTMIALMEFALAESDEAQDPGRPH